MRLRLHPANQCMGRKRGWWCGACAHTNDRRLRKTVVSVVIASMWHWALVLPALHKSREKQDWPPPVKSCPCARRHPFEWRKNKSEKIAKKSSTSHWEIVWLRYLRNTLTPRVAALLAVYPIISARPTKPFVSARPQAFVATSVSTSSAEN